MNKEDLLANCIDEVDSGKYTLEECLAKYPELRDELRPLLEVAQCLQTKKVTPSPEFRMRARSRLLQEMRRPEPALRPRRSILDWFRPLAPALKPVIAVALVIAGLSAAGTTTIYAAQGSLPQDTLYPVKRGVENLQLVLTPDNADKARLNANLAERRVEEAVAQAKLGREIDASALQSSAAHIDAAVRHIAAARPEQARELLGGLSRSSLNEQLELDEILPTLPEKSQQAVRKAIETTRRANLIAGTAYGNPKFLTTSPSVLDDGIEAAHFEVEGVFLSDEDGNWNVGGVVIKNVESSQSAPGPSENVRVEGVVRGEKVFVSEIKRKEDRTDKSIEAAIAPPQPTPEQVREVQNPDLAGAADREDEDEDKGIEVNGTLAGTDQERNTISVTVSGSKVSINLREASVQDANGNALGLSELEALQGADVKATGLTRKDGVLSARRIRIDSSLKESSEDQQSEKDRSTSTQPTEDKKSNKNTVGQGQAKPGRTPTPRETGKATPVPENQSPRATAAPVPAPDPIRPRNGNTTKSRGRHRAKAATIKGNPADKGPRLP